MAIRNASKNYKAPCNKHSSQLLQKSSIINKFDEQYIQVQKDSAIHFHVESHNCEIVSLLIVQQ